ncbi:MAG: right-handed parallel beta-helix repeat-containing protein [Clostridia bacterium]
MDILLSKKGVKDGDDISLILAEALKELQPITEKKNIIFPQGTFFLDSALCSRHKLHITNTMGEGEYRNGETPFLHTVGIYMENIHNLSLIGNGATLMVKGKMTNIVMENCSNISLEGLSIQTQEPDIHPLTVKAISATTVDFEINPQDKYVVEGKKIFFVGQDYRMPIDECKHVAWWTGKICVDTPNSIKRGAHPFWKAVAYREIAPNVVRAYYFSKPKCKVGDIYNIFDVRRKYVGIFVNNCKDVTLIDVEQGFNYSLAFVAQCSENITLERVRFAPQKGDFRKEISIADFIQVCMCRGEVVVKDSYFEGAGDDCLNVHGMHFRVEAIRDRSIQVAFKHPQSFGYNGLFVGDEIEYIEPTTLLTIGKAKISASKMIDLYTIELEVSNVDGCRSGCVIEDVTACPNLTFVGNTMDRIITRGILITTRGKVLVQGNKFLNNSMSTILLSNDAKSWFESGRVEDITICDNLFANSLEYDILVKPENGLNKTPVHSNIVIRDNQFNSPTNGGIYIKSSRDVTIKDNKIACPRADFLTCKDVENLVSDIQ